jgi:hypothetical protein
MGVAAIVVALSLNRPLTFESKVESSTSADEIWNQTNKTFKKISYKFILTFLMDPYAKLCNSGTNPCQIKNSNYFGGIFSIASRGGSCLIFVCSGRTWAS